MREPVDGFAILGKMLRLAADGLCPAQSKPGEVLLDQRLEFRPAAAFVDILDAQEEAPADAPAKLEVEKGGISVAEVKLAIRRGREAENGLHGLSSSRPGLFFRLRLQALVQAPRLLALASRS